MAGKQRESKKKERKKQKQASDVNLFFVLESLPPLPPEHEQKPSVSQLRSALLLSPGFDRSAAAAAAVASLQLEELLEHPE